MSDLSYCETILRVNFGRDCTKFDVQMQNFQGGQAPDPLGGACTQCKSHLLVAFAQVPSSKKKQQIPTPLVGSLLVWVCWEYNIDSLVCYMQSLILCVYVCVCVCVCVCVYIHVCSPSLPFNRKLSRTAREISWKILQMQFRFELICAFEINLNSWDSTMIIVHISIIVIVTCVFLKKSF